MRRIPGSAPAFPLGSYVGRYENEGYGVLTIELEGDGLSMVFNGIRSPLDHWHFETFNTGTSEDPSFEDLKVTFDSSGESWPTAVMVPFEPAVGPIEFRRVGSSSSDTQWLAALEGDYLDGASAVRWVTEMEVRTWSGLALRRVGWWPGPAARPAS